MAFHETKTFSNQDSSVKIDVESLAMLEISDIEYILEKAKTSDPRLKKVLFESALTKCATVWQLAMKAWKYLESIENLNTMKESHSKESGNGIGLIGSLRGNLFHSGVGFYERTTYYPFGHVHGRGYVAIRVRKGGCLRIIGYSTLEAKDSEFAITSEGIYEIIKPNTIEEKWIKKNDLLTVDASDDQKVEDLILSGLSDLQQIWNDVRTFRMNHMDHEISFLNDGGGWILAEETEGEINSYKSTSHSITVYGDLTLTPPKVMEIHPSEGIVKY